MVHKVNRMVVRCEQRCGLGPGAMAHGGAEGARTERWGRDALLKNHLGSLPPFTSADTPFLHWFCLVCALLLSTTTCAVQKCPARQFLRLHCLQRCSLVFYSLIAGGSPDDQATAGSPKFAAYCKEISTSKRPLIIAGTGGRCGKRCRVEGEVRAGKWIARGKHSLPLCWDRVRRAAEVRYERLLCLDLAL